MHGCILVNIMDALVVKSTIIAIKYEIPKKNFKNCFAEETHLKLNRFSEKHSIKLKKVSYIHFLILT